MKNTKFVVKRIFPFDSTRKAAAVLKKGTVRETSRLDQETKDRAVSGKDFLRIPGTTKFPRRVEEEEMKSQYGKTSRRWSWKAHLPARLPAFARRDAERGRYESGVETEEATRARTKFYSEFFPENNKKQNDDNTDC